MSTITFSPADAADSITPNPAPVAVTPVVESAIVVPAAQTLAPAMVEGIAMGGSGIEGEISLSDIRPPRINLAQKTGKIGDEFTPGSFVYDKDFLLSAPGKSFNATVLRFKKYFQQKTEFEAGRSEMPQRFDTEAEVKAAGGTLDYSKEAVKEGRYFPKAADLLLAIEAPEGIDESKYEFFPYAVEGKNYGLAAYTITSSAFTSLGQRIITDGRFLLANGIWTGQYRISSEKKVTPEISWFVPTASFDRKHSPEACAFFRSLAGR